MNASTTLEKVTASKELQQNLDTLISEVAAEEKVQINNNRTELLMALNAKLTEAIIEILEDIEDSRIAREVREEIRSGKMETIPWEKFKKELKSKQQPNG